MPPMGHLFLGHLFGKPLGLGLSLTPPIPAPALLSLRGGPRADARRCAPLVLAAPGWVVLCLPLRWQVRCLFAPHPQGSVGVWPWFLLVPGAGSRSRSARLASAVCFASSGPSGISLPPAGIGAGRPLVCLKLLRPSWSSS